MPIEIDQNLHNKLKSIAASSGTTVDKLINDVLLNHANNYDADTTELHRRFVQAHNPEHAMSHTDAMAVVRQALERKKR